MGHPHKMNEKSDQSDGSDGSDKSYRSDRSDELLQELNHAQRQVGMLITLLTDIREASGVGMQPMAFDLPEAIRQRIEDGAAWSPERRATLLAQHQWLAKLAARRPAVAAALDPENQPEGATTVSVLLTVVRAATNNQTKTKREKR